MKPAEAVRRLEEDIAAGQWIAVRRTYSKVHVQTACVDLHTVHTTITTHSPCICFRYFVYLSTQINSDFQKKFFFNFCVCFRCCCCCCCCIKLL